MAMLRFIAACLFLAVAVVLSITAGDVLAAGNDEAVASALMTGDPDTHAAVSACAGAAAGEQEKYQQKCCDGLFCAAAAALAQPSAGSVALPASDAIYPAASGRMTGRDVAPETGPPKYII